MNLKIVQLMRAPLPTRDMCWLQGALQSAVELELATLPPYLCGLWALEDKDGSSYAARQILSIAKQEMAHFGLACNMLRAVGERPDIVGGYDAIEYPGPLPGGVRPKCDPQFFPGDSNFEVTLGFADFCSFLKMCMQIEYPEDPVPKPMLLALEETFPSIGEFYDAVLAVFKTLDGAFEYQAANQLKGPLGIFVVDGLTAATRAIQQIQQQGEGAARNPYYAPGKLAHFYAFGELYYRREYSYDAVKQTGDWTGTEIDMPIVFPMSPVPKNGYVNPPQEVLACDLIFTKMLSQLDEAWSKGDAGGLGSAIGSMTDLSDAARVLLSRRIPRPDAPGIFGPQFRKAN